MPQVQPNAPRTLRQLTIAMALTLPAFGSPLPVSAADTGAQNTAKPQSAALNFNIPAQPLVDALNAFIAVSDWQVGFPAGMAKDIRSSAVHGRYTPQQALQQLLTGSGLSYRLTGANTVTLEIVPQSQADIPVLKVMTVVGEAVKDVDDPDNGDYQISNAVTATKTDTPIMETPVSIKVVPQQVLKDQQVITLDQALKNVSGAVSGAGGTGTFFLRGFGNYNIYRDGYLNQSQWAHTEDLANVERVEVLKGPGSILYGRTEPGGLVNFVTKKPLDTPYYSLGQQFGSFDFYRTNVDVTGPLPDNEDLAYRFNLGYQTNRTFQEFGGNERLFVSPSLRWKISDQTTSILKIEYSDIQDKGIGRVPLMGNRPAPIPRSRNMTDSWSHQEDEYVMLSLHTEHVFNEDWKLRHRFNFSNYELAMSGMHGGRVNKDGDGGRAFFAQNIDGNDYQHNFFTSLELTGKFDTAFLKHTLLLGGDYYRSDYRSTMAGFGANPDLYDTTNIYNPVHRPGPPAILPSDITYGNFTLPWFGLYAQDQIELPYDFHLLAGVRYDNAESFGSSVGEFGGPVQDSSYDRLTPRGGLLWQPIPELSLYGSYTENFGAMTTFGANTQPLPPQTAQQWETGIKVELFDGRFNSTLSYFDLTKQNLPIQVNQLETRAVGEAESRGLELDFTGEILPGWNIIGAYAYTPFAKTLKDSVGADTEGKRLNNAPEHSGSLWSTYEFQDQLLQGVKFGAGVQAVGQREIGYNETAQAPGYVTVNMMASKLWKVGDSRVTAQFNIDNLINKTYIDRIYSFGPSHYGVPRTFMGYIKLEY